MSFLYPRTVAIRREAERDDPGEQEYGGVSQSTEEVVRDGIPAHIEVDRLGKRAQAGLPADAAGQALWTIIFRVPRGLVRSRDVIADDLGNRYQVISADWGPLVTSCQAQILEN